MIITSRPQTLYPTTGLIDFEVSGSCDKLLFLSGDTPIQVKLESKSATPITLQPGWTLKGKFDVVYISCSASTNPIELVFSNDDKFTIEKGLINIGQDQSAYYDAVNFQNTFVCVGVVNAGATDYTNFLLFNPADSGVNCVIDNQYFFYPGTSTSLRLYWYDSTLATDDSQRINSCLLGSGATAKTKIYYELLASQIIPSLSQKLYDRYISANVEEYDFPKNLILPPGVGLLCYPVVTNISLRYSISFKEIPII